MTGPATTRRTRTPAVNERQPPSVRADTEDIFASGSSVRLGRSGASLALPAVLGQYKIIKQLGKGGMARVFLAEHINLRRLVAIKVLPEELAQNRAARERFYREARTAAALDHPNIVRAYDVREADGLHFLVMEYVEGQDLEAVMQARGPCHIPEAVSWIVDAAHGLEHAAQKHVVHRDIKPGNLLLDKHGTVKILDMGLARFHDHADDRVTDELDSGAVMCTPDYAAPEQIMRRDDVDTRADIYALGATLYALLTGRPPFEGSVTMKLVAHQSREAIPLQRMRADIPKALSEVVARMMAKNPDERYPTPQAVIAALAPWTVKAATRHTVAESDTVPQNEWAEFMAAVDAELPKPPKRDRHRSLILGAIAFLPVMLLLGLMVRQMIHVWRA